MKRERLTLVVDGERKTYAEWSAWAKETLGLDLPAKNIAARIRQGCDPKTAVTRPFDVGQAAAVRARKAIAREDQGAEPLLTRRGPEGIASFLRGGAAGDAARAALPKAPPKRRAEP